MKSRLIFLISVLCVFTNSAWAFQKEFQQKNFDAEYREFLKEYDSLLNTLPKNLRYVGRKHSNRARPYISPKYRSARQQITQMQIVKTQYDPFFDLKNTFVEMYKKSNPPQNFNPAELESESVELAFGVIGEIKRLRGKYKSFFLPLVHNAMIDVGIKKRGACKHWAEDLLNFMRPYKRKFFTITWGEANPTKMDEHNVAVVLPAHSEFNQGLLIDPWRTSGVPYWVGVTKDPHYKWRPWDSYGYH